MFTAGRLLRERAMTEGSSASRLHLGTLRYVAEKKQPLMREVAQFLRISPPSTTSLVNTLVKQGKVRRIEDKNDRRTVRLEVTERGHRTLAESARRKHGLMQDALKELNEHERMEFKNILEKIIRFSAEKK